VLEKSNKFHKSFFASTLFESISDTHMTLIQQASCNIQIGVSKVESEFFYGPTFFIHFLVKSQTLLKKLNTYWNNVINEELKAFIFIRIFLFLFNNKSLNKNQILSYVAVLLSFIFDIIIVEISVLCRITVSISKFMLHRFIVNVLFSRISNINDNYFFIFFKFFIYLI
jgi:hypothetical protein